MRYQLAWADLGPNIHAVLGIEPERRLLLVNTQEPAGASSELCAILRQAVDIAYGSPLGRKLLAERTQVEALLARLDRALDPPRRAARWSFGPLQTGIAATGIALVGAHLLETAPALLPLA